MPTVILHIQNDDPVLGELDALPAMTDQMVIIKNPRRKDGKDVGYIDAKVLTVIWPLSKITFIEILPSGEDEEIITFVRE